MKKFNGLTSQEVEASKQAHGTNALSQKEATSIFEIFMDAMKDQWILILLAALLFQVIINTLAMFNPIFGHANWLETISLVVAILLSTGFSTISEYRNELNFNKLQDEASKTLVKVYRDGKLKEILIDDIVKGDQILVQAGDKIPVDGILLDGTLKVNQAAVNGESDDVIKLPLDGRPEPDANDLFTELRVFRGTVAVSGEAVIEATVIGDNTIMGSINTALQEDAKESPSTGKLAHLAKSIGVLGYSGAGLYVAIAIISVLTRSIETFMALSPALVFVINTILYAVTIIIMAVPEGLPMMLAMVAAMNSGNLLKQHILVRKPDSVETAGYTNILFSDKTGTITKGVLSVVDFILGDGTLYNTTNSGHGSEFKEMNEDVKSELLIGIGDNNDSVVSEDEVSGKKYAAGSNNTDKALLNFLIDNDLLDFNNNDVVVIEKEQFNSATKFASITLSNGLKYIKGAPEFTMSDVKFYLDENGKQQPITEDSTRKLDEVSLQQANRSMRLLAIIREENGVKTLIALTCIRDNIRDDIPQTVKDLDRAGVQLVMVTGDRKETAVAIAKDAGIIKSDDDIVLTHDELDAMSDEEVKEALPKLRVVSRALPLDKKRLVNLAQDLDMVAGMTGDGVNDSPALKSADVGFAMGDGTQTAQEASDIVIVNNSLASITKAILYGRTMTKSVQKFIKFQLTVNVATIAISLLVPLFGLFVPVLSGVKEVFSIIMILWINLIMDTFAAMMFGEEPPLDKYMSEAPVAKKARILTNDMKAAIGTAATFITVGSLLILTNTFGIQEFITKGTGNFEMVTTFNLTFFIYAILWNALNTRSTGLDILSHISKNKKFVWIMVLIMVVQTLILQFGGVVFGTVPMDIEHYLVAAGLAALVIPIDMVRKVLTRKK